MNDAWLWSGLDYEEYVLSMVVIVSEGLGASLESALVGVGEMFLLKVFVQRLMPCSALEVIKV